MRGVGKLLPPPFPSSQSPLVLLIYINSDPLLFNSANSLKRFGLNVHKNENFFGSDFEICNFSFNETISVSISVLGSKTEAQFIFKNPKKLLFLFLN